MTVQELMDKLSKIEDKSMPVVLPIYEYGGYDPLKSVATAKMCPIIPGKEKLSEANSLYRFHTEYECFCEGSIYQKDLVPVCLVDIGTPYIPTEPFNTDAPDDTDKAEMIIL